MQSKPVTNKILTGMPRVQTANNGSKDPWGANMTVRTRHTELSCAITYAASSKLTVVENPRVAVKLNKELVNREVEERIHGGTLTSGRS